MKGGKPVAAAVAEPDEDVWEELRDEWEAFLLELEEERHNRTAAPSTFLTCANGAAPL